MAEPASQTGQKHIDPFHESRPGPAEVLDEGADLRRGVLGRPIAACQHKRGPASDGPYVCAREAFGEFAGFLNAWPYWITAWAGNAATVMAWIGCDDVFVNTGHKPRNAASEIIHGRSGTLIRPDLVVP